MFPAMLPTATSFRSDGARRNLLKRSFYKHFVPTGRGALVRKTCYENTKLDVGVTEIRKEGSASFAPAYQPGAQQRFELNISAPRARKRRIDEIYT